MLDAGYNCLVNARWFQHRYSWVSRLVAALTQSFYAHGLFGASPHPLRNEMGWALLERAVCLTSRKSLRRGRAVISDSV